MKTPGTTVVRGEKFTNGKWSFSMIAIHLPGVVMTTAGPEHRKSAARRVAKLSGGCWVDLFEGPWFTGKLRRLYGPAEIHKAAIQDFLAGSMIVGPEAKV